MLKENGKREDIPMNKIIKLGVSFKRISNSGKIEYCFVCRCHCGKSFICKSNHISKMKSCGCLGYKRHREVNSKSYSAWSEMKYRCDNPKIWSYKHYGGRGISYCDRWKTFELFYQDMGDAPVGKSLDRKNNEENYSKENCRWATHKEQQRNKRNNRILTINNISKTMIEWSEEEGAVNYKAMGNRVIRGWNDHDIVFHPLHKKLKKKSQNVE